MVLESEMLSGRVRTGLCILVAIAWALSIGLQMIHPSYQPDPSINVLFSGVIGLVLASGAKSESNDRRDKDDDKRGRRR